MFEPATGELRSVDVGVRFPAIAGEWLTGLGIYGATVVVTIACAALAGSPIAWTRSTLVALVAGAVLLQALSMDLPARRMPRLGTVALVSGALAALCLLATTGLPVRPYGDGAILTQFVGDGRPMPRWLLGSTVAAVVHAATWELPSVQGWLPERLQTTGAFLSILGTAVLVVGTAAVWRRWPGRLAVLLPVCTPVWVLFASGYVEYYPLIAPAYLATLAWLFEQPLGARRPEAIGGLVGVLPVLYLGFAPAAACVLIAYATVRRSDAARTMVVAAGVAALTVATCWPEGLVNYVRTLSVVINVGDAHLHPMYAGQVAGASSMMFSWQAATGAPHLQELWFLLVRGGGWWALPLLIVAAVWRLRQSRAAGAYAITDGRVRLAALLLVAYLYYFVFMIPRLGPVEDIDLFFPTFVLVAFLGGQLLDGVRDGHDRRRTRAVLAVALAALACTAPALVSGVLAAPH